MRLNPDVSCPFSWIFIAYLMYHLKDLAATLAAAISHQSGIIYPESTLTFWDARSVDKKQPTPTCID